MSLLIRKQGDERQKIGIPGIGVNRGARGLCSLEKGTDQRNKTERSLNDDVNKTPGIHLNTEIRIFVFNIKCIPFDIPR